MSLYTFTPNIEGGQGTYPLGEAVAHAPKLGVRTLATTIFASNEASLHLFHSHGFQEWGRLPGVADLGGGVIHDVVFVGRQVSNSTDSHLRQP